MAMAWKDTGFVIAVLWGALFSDKSRLKNGASWLGVSAPESDGSGHTSS